jgi:hypothetical protein
MSYEHVPAAVEYLLLIVCGNEWPTGDTGQLRSDAEAWRSVSQGLSTVQQSADSSANLAESGFSGPAGTAFTDYWNSLTTSNQPFIPLLMQVCDELADSLDEAADQIETVRIDITASVIILAAELAWDEAMAFFTAGASMEAAAEEIAITRATILRYVRRAAMQLAEHEIKQSMLQFVIDLIAQGIEKIEHPGRPINWEEAGFAAVNGAVGGAVGFGAGLLFKGIGKGLSEIDHLSGGLGSEALDKLTGMAGLKSKEPPVLTLGGDLTAGPHAEGLGGGLTAGPHTNELGGDLTAGPRTEGQDDDIGPAPHAEGLDENATPAPHAETLGATPGGTTTGGLNRGGKIVAYAGKLVGDVALNVAVGPAEAAAQDAALNGGQVSQSDPEAGALNGIGNGVFGRLGKVYSGDGPLDTALKKGGELLDDQFQNIKNMFMPATTEPPASDSSESSESANSQGTESGLTSHEPSPAASIHSGASGQYHVPSVNDHGLDIESIHSTPSSYTTAPTTRAPSPAPSVHSTWLEHPVTEPSSPVVSHAPDLPPRTRAPSVNGHDVDIESIHSTLSSYTTAPTTRAPSPAPSVHSVRSEYMTPPSSPVISHAQGLPSATLESGLPLVLAGSLASGLPSPGMPASLTPVVTSDVPETPALAPVSGVESESARPQLGARAQGLPGFETILTSSPAAPEQSDNPNAAEPDAETGAPDADSRQPEGLHGL